MIDPFTHTHVMLLDVYSMRFVRGPMETDKANEQQDFHDPDMTGKGEKEMHPNSVTTV